MLPEWTLAGFTGHRELPNPAVAAAGIRAALDKLAERCCPLAVISSAASGADTLFVEEVGRRNLPFQIILPFAVSRFENDFKPEDWKRVQPLLEKAAQVEEVTSARSNEEGYLEAGVRMVERADVLIAVWNGQPPAGPGGTADAVACARALEKPLLWIHSVTGAIVEERMDRLPPKSATADLPTDPRQQLEAHFKALDAEAAAHAPKARNLILRIILLHLIASAAGVMLLVLEQHGEIAYVVTGFEVAILGYAFTLIARHRRKHEAWMKNRIEAEICRSFLATWRIFPDGNYFPIVAIGGTDRVCAQLRLMQQMDRSPQGTLEAARARYLEGRIQDQINYFAGHQSEAKTRLGGLKGLALACTAIAALGGAAALTFSLMGWSGAALKVAKSLSLVLPLVSASLFSLIVAQEYSRRAKRYREMVALLEEAVKRMEAVRTWDSLARVARQTEGLLLQEAVEWHSYTRFAGEPH